MASRLPVTVDPRAVVGKAREVVAKVRPGATEGRRSLPIRGEADEIRRLWADADGRAAVLEGIAVADATLDFGPVVPEWGTTVTVTLTVETAVPGMATQVLAGKVVRRLKALVETGEVPTTAHNPSARPDAGAPA
jgi:hypothetical protein